MSIGERLEIIGKDLVMHYGEYFLLVMEPGENAFVELQQGEALLDDSTSVPYSAVVYLGEGIPRKFWEPVLFHEIMESRYMRQGWCNGESHEKAKIDEEEYAMEHLDDVTRREYFGWSSIIRSRRAGSLFDSY